MLFVYRNLMRGCGAMALATAMCCLGTPAFAQGDTYEHLDEMALDLQRFAEEIVEETHAHLQGNAYFPQIDRAAHRIEELAAHVHRVAHDRGDIVHLRNDIDDLDRWVHHIDDLGNFIARRGVRSSEWGGFQYMRSCIASMLDTLHHMQDDLHQLAPRRSLHDHDDYHQRYPDYGHRTHRYPARGYIGPGYRPAGHDHFHSGHHH
ncbi:hypothetical protein [Lignipirellula cremea]|uniref:Secreted protein n=1 Tax=Lignipirellula cremea TaxID=2528010 RepID=A0A518E3M7_9BACT|nr:hypothetical protein [Lignipirellula cremea]QDU98691.1 hypothetical protein Pla8534_65640 [Lignipirellula cremea]